MGATRPSHVVRFGNFDFDVETGDLWNNGRRTRLQEQPRQVLLMLLAHPGELVTRDALRTALWPDDTFVDFDAGVNVVVNKIRHVLRDSAASPRFIETIPRRGYRFIAPVASAPVRDDARPDPPDPGDAIGGDSARRLFGLARGSALSTDTAVSWRGLLLASAIVAALAIPALMYLWREESSGPPAPPPVASSSERTVPAASSNGVAVAPLENQTADASLQWLGQMAAERIIGVVANVSGTHVVPRPGPIATGAASASAPLVADSSVSLLVTGTYFVREDRLEFQARIHDAASGRLLHATTPVTGPLSQPAAGLQLLEQKVAGAIAIHFDDFFGGLHAVSHPPTLDAYREYRAGLETFWSDYPRALAHFARALETDPEFVPALMVRNMAQANLNESRNVDANQARLERLWARASPAERLWIEHSRAVREGRRLQALRLLEDMERLVPASLFVNHNLVQASLGANRPAAAVRAYDKRRFDERTLRHSIGTLRQEAVMAALHLLGQHERELRQAKMAQAFAPGDMHQLEVEARALVGLGRAADISRVIDRSLSMTLLAGPPHPAAEVMEGAARELRAHGYRDESLKVAARAVDWYRSRPRNHTAARAHRDGLARALYLAERWEEADVLFSALAAEHPDAVDYVVSLGCIAARRNDSARALRISDDLTRIRETRIGWAPVGALATFGRSRIAALLHDRQRAVDLLRDALARGLPYGIALHDEPDHASLRDYGPYLELTRPLD